MKLEFEDYELGKKIVDEAMKLPDADIEFYLENSVEAFIVAGDLTNFEFRCKIRLFLGHLSTLFLNYSLNGGHYGLSELDTEKAFRCREKICNLLIMF